MLTIEVNILLIKMNLFQRPGKLISRTDCINVYLFAPSVALTLTGLMHFNIVMRNMRYRYMRLHFLGKP